MKPEAGEAARSQWSEARPEIIPSPSIAPPAMAFGITLFMWGLLTSVVLIVVGLVVMITALTFWIGEIRHARRS